MSAAPRVAVIGGGWAGLSAEATGDALRKFADQGRLEVYGDRIIVKNIVDLARFVTTRRTKDNNFFG